MYKIWVCSRSRIIWRGTSVSLPYLLVYFSICVWLWLTPDCLCYKKIPLEPNSPTDVMVPLPAAGVPDVATIKIEFTTENPDDDVDVSNVEVVACNKPSKLWLRDQSFIIAFNAAFSSFQYKKIWTMILSFIPFYRNIWKHWVKDISVFNRYLL